MKEFIFTWDVENISYSWHQTGKRIDSPKFVASSLNNTSWNLSLYPRGKENSDYLSLSLCICISDDRESEHPSINVEFSCITADTSELHKCFKSKTFNYYYSECLESLFMERHEVFGRRKDLYLQQDILSLRCRMWTDNAEVDEFGQSFGCTRLEIERLILVENINLEDSEKKTFQIQSKRNKLIMSIGVLCCGDMMVEIIPGEESNKFSTCELSLENEIGRKICQSFCFFRRPDKNEWRLPLSEEFSSSERDCLDNSNCVLTVKLVHSTGEESKKVEMDHPPKTSHFLSKYIGYSWSGYDIDCPNISEDLGKLVQGKDLCDVELRVKNSTCAVHRDVLCARSPVFLAMFTHSMKEKENRCIEIEDISVDTLNCFLHFLYRDFFNNSNWSKVIELYEVADKYQVERLKHLCCSYFLQNIDVYRVFEILMLADKHHDFKLKHKINDIIWKNEKTCFMSPAWRKFADEQQELAFETMRSKYEATENLNPDEWMSNYTTIQDDLRSFYENGIEKDVVIRTATASYPAYKTFLCAGSLTFKNIFLRDESLDSINIADLDDNTVSKVLLFLHFDSFSDIQWRSALKLYHAAVVYQIDRLKFRCSCYLIENLRVHNACELLQLALEHSDAELKSVVIIYICVYHEEIFRSKDWDDFCAANHSLALEIMREKYRCS